MLTDDESKKLTGGLAALLSVGKRIAREADYRAGLGLLGVCLGYLYLGALGAAGVGLIAARVGGHIEAMCTMVRMKLAGSSPPQAKALLPRPTATLPAIDETSGPTNVTSALEAKAL